MEEQTYKIKNVKSFEPVHIFDCGQCFRWDKELDGSYTGVFKGNVMNVKKDGNNVTFKGICNGNIEEICRDYFDLNTDYEDIKDKISKKYGTEVDWNGTKYYTFPTVEELSKASVEDLRALGLGFRDVRVYETTKKILNKEVDLNKLTEEKDTEKVREKLLTLPGVGPKVADCILLFSTLKRFEVFPIDVWVRRVMNDLYIKNPDETKVNKREIEKLAKEKYGNLAGLAQQYLFYWKREA